jgi:hypothetical protein
MKNLELGFQDVFNIGLEPTPFLKEQILSLSRLPIPPIKQLNVKKRKRREAAPCIFLE